MAVSNEDLARMIVTLEVTTTRYFNELKKAQTRTNQTATAIETRLSGMSSKIDKTFANLGQRMSANLTGPLAGIGAAFSTREIVRYADAWTEAGNRVRAAGSIIGMQGRSLEGIRQIADDSRAGFTATTELYSRLLRSAGAVANSELDIARATEIVTKAFKAGGAATSEMNGGILQLSQGLASGILQGDELRSVRENAPVLAQVMADYFKVTIGGLKELGSQGKLTSTEVFRAILSGEREIMAAFATTNRTIGDSFLLVENALIQYIGLADQSNGVTATISSALTALADNFDVVADGALKLAAIIAGALVGRSLIGMISTLGLGVTALGSFAKSLRDARAAGAGASSIFTAMGALGPLALLVGGVAAVAFQGIAAEANRANNNIEQIDETLAGVGITAKKHVESLREAVTQTNALADAEERLQGIRASQNVDNLLDANWQQRFINSFSGAVGSLGEVADKAVRMLQTPFVDGMDKIGYEAIRALANSIKNGTAGTAEQIEAQFQAIAELDISDPVLELATQLKNLSIDLENANLQATIFVDTSALDEASASLNRIYSDLAQSPVSPELQTDLNEAITHFDGTAESAQLVYDKIFALSLLNPDLSAVLSQITNATQKFIAMAAAAEAAKIAADAIMGPALQRQQGRRDANNYLSGLMRRKTEGDNTSAFIDEQNRQLSLTEDQLALEEEIAKVKKEALTLETQITDAQATDLATRRIAQKESFKDSSSSPTDAEKFFEDLEGRRISNENLQKEIELRGQLNPLVNDYGFALLELQTRQELINAATKAGIALTPELMNAINALATATASVVAADEKLTEAQKQSMDVMQERFDLAKSATRGFIDDLIEGKSAAEAFGNALNQLGSYLINLGLGAIFGQGGGDLGLAGQLLGIPGRATGGDVRKGQPYIVGEKRPELFVPTQNGIIVPRVPNQMGAAGNTNVPVQINIDATGADAGGLARVEAAIVRLRSELPYAIRSEVLKKSKKGWG